MRSLLSLTVVILFSAVVFPPPAIRAGDPAREVLEKVRKKYDAIADGELRYTQTTIFPVAKLEQHLKGMLVFKKGNRYRVEMEDQTIVTDGTTVWSYSVRNHQVLIDNFTADERSLTPERILVSAPDDFTPILVGQEKVGKFETTVVKLIPRSEQVLIQSMKLWVDESESLIRMVEILDAGGKTTTYTVTDLRLNTGVPDARFVFQIPEGADVVDLR
jgi:outer membrane lipoprotein carrier protein